MTLVSGLVHDHSLWLVGVAGLLCLAGAWATSRFFQRMTETSGAQRYAGLFLTALASGVTIWCTHFVAMLGFHPGVATSFGWTLTGVSLLVALLGSAVGFLIAGSGPSRIRPAAGGVVVGLSVASMHYVGMRAMHMDGTMSWSTTRVVVSIVLGVLLAGAALHVSRSQLRCAENAMWGLFAASVLLLHVTGMSAVTVHHLDHMAGMPDMAGMPTPIDTASQHVLAVAVAAMSFVTIGASAVGYLIDGLGRAAATADHLRQLAMFDELTGLPNRAHLKERFSGEIERARLAGHRVAMVVIDVDNFKEINDLYGHPVGDEVLRVLGGRMADFVRDGEGKFVARIGGDEFVAMCPIADRDHLRACLEGLRQALKVSIPVGDDTLSPRSSIGAAIFPDDAVSAEMLVNNADLAMYRAKSDPLLDVCIYDPALDERTRLRRGLTSDLRDAVARDELALHYQVQTSVATGEPIGYEALLRWQHPQLGAVSPAEFIPLAEDSGLIVPIGEWVLRTACAEAARWHPPRRVSVNVSAVQLAEPGFAALVRQVLVESGLPARRLELEMTETAVFTDREHALRTLGEIKALGVAIALDDFGVGYSSLDALRSFPFDRIKIDRSFFSGINTAEETVELIQTILTLGRTFGMSVLAEGIETPEHLALLTDAGCLEAQGFLFGRPTPLEEIVRSGQLGMGDGQESA